MNKPIYTLFVVFWTAIGTLVAVDALQAETEQPPPEGDKAGSPTFTLETVAKHNTVDDCWMAIEGIVYDFTDYIPNHPTEPEVMAEWCGREATKGMREKGDRGRPHSEFAWSQMAKYRIGTLAD